MVDFIVKVCFRDKNGRLLKLRGDLPISLSCFKLVCLTLTVFIITI